jgi:hypothetical protein
LYPLLISGYFTTIPDREINQLALINQLAGTGAEFSNILI